ncbi:MAG: hypothetical protein N2691_02895 [Patescibacteria group bacterium]|nr:hypothetical protein [Patescibacteria group bacterium]
MNKKIVRLKNWITTNPLYAFLAVAGFVTVVFGVIAFLPKGTSADKNLLATQESETGNDTGLKAPTRKPDRVTLDKEFDTDESANTLTDKKSLNPTKRPTKEPSPSPTRVFSPTPTTEPTLPPSTDYSYNYLGDIFADLNCNGMRDAGENPVPDITVNLFRMPDESALATVKTDVNGHYSYSGKHPKGESLTVKIRPVETEAYKLVAPVIHATDTVSDSAPSRRHDIRMVPAENLASCAESTSE